jgi:hypothetical protein
MHLYIFVLLVVACFVVILSHLYSLLYTNNPLGITMGFHSVCNLLAGLGLLAHFGWVYVNWGNKFT